MIFYRLNDDQGRRAAAAIMAAIPVAAFLVLHLADRDRVGMAIGLVSLMMILLPMIVVQIVQSRRTNAEAQETLNG